MSSLDTSDLKAKALALTDFPGPWTWNEQGWLCSPFEGGGVMIVVDSPEYSTGSTAEYLSAVDPTTILALIDHADRQTMLRAQSVSVAEERTRERDQLRAAMPAGLAFELLVAQIRRLRRTPCETMSFDPASGPAEMVKALRRELDELDAETAGSIAWKREALDVFTCALHLLIAADMLVDVSVAEQASKLGARLDHIDRGGTWADAKRMETGVCEECSGFGFRPVWAPIDGVVEDEACPHCRGSGQRI